VASFTGLGAVNLSDIGVPPLETIEIEKIASPRTIETLKLDVQD